MSLFNVAARVSMIKMVAVFGVSFLFLMIVLLVSTSVNDPASSAKVI
jgi:hypothetical protein